ncbi:(2Fe-2S) ferredoxin [Rhodococcoides trifolii]|uniref:(2Fe-2S) ferredoxin n=1 Tax=Rhodococcoides trifolii TaxID=908250 RepID=A0A917G657_9NOCA|nr:aromatic ring-hydroxylating dioxygenase subunit alpha [Rhodococcus trifolii]GGG23787.1 (2Fe-2S) ferredoxin [Rhodococcus trifolii]
MSVDARPSTQLVPTLPGRYYTDPQIFAEEQRRIFGTNWVYVARSDQFTRPGDFLRTEVAGQSVIVVRTRTGALKGYLNVCRHRGSQLCRTDDGNLGHAIRCPYHAWVYRLDDGALMATPNWKAMSDIDKSEFDLAPVGVHEWKGLVWVNLAGGDENSLLEQIRTQLAYRLDGDVTRFDRYGMENLVVGGSITYECAANWKIIFENFQECYHCGTIHPELVEQIPTFASFDQLGDGAYHTGGYPFADGRDGFNSSGTRTLPILPGLTSDDDCRYFGMILRPNAFVSLVPDHVIVHRFEPLAPDRTRLVCEWLFDQSVLGSDRYDVRESIELFDRVNVQDLDASALCQPGMSSPLYRDGGVLVPTESEIIGNWFYPWYRQQMGL